MQIPLLLAGWFVASVTTGLVLGWLLRQLGWERHVHMDQDQTDGNGNSKVGC